MTKKFWVWPLLTIILTPILTAFCTVAANYWQLLSAHKLELERREKWEEYKHNEERYRGLVLSVRAFHAASSKGEALILSNRFLQEVDLCSIYCSDEVTQKAYDFLERLRPKNNYSREEKEMRLKMLLLAIRKDLFHNFGKTTVFTRDRIYLSGQIPEIDTQIDSDKVTTSKIKSK